MVAQNRHVEVQSQVNALPGIGAVPNGVSEADHFGNRESLHIDQNGLESLKVGMDVRNNGLHGSSCSLTCSSGEYLDARTPAAGFAGHAAPGETTSPT